MTTGTIGYFENICPPLSMRLAVVVDEVAAEEVDYSSMATLVYMGVLLLK